MGMPYPDFYNPIYGCGVKITPDIKPINIRLGIVVALPEFWPQLNFKFLLGQKLVCSQIWCKFYVRICHAKQKQKSKIREN